MGSVFNTVEAMKREGVIDDYAVAGAVGAQFYTEPFSTQDIDLLVHFPSSQSLLVSIEPIKTWMQSHGHEMSADGFFLIDDWPVQFLPVGSDLMDEALQEARYLQYGEGEVRVVRAEYLASEALRLSRAKDIHRISQLLNVRGFDLNLFENLIEKFGLAEKWKRIESFLSDEQGV